MHPFAFGTPRLRGSCVSVVDPDATIPRPVRAIDLSIGPEPEPPPRLPPRRNWIALASAPLPSAHPRALSADPDPTQSRPPVFYDE